MKQLLGAILALLVPFTAAAADDLPILYPAPAFKLTDQDGRSVSLDDLKGKTWVVDFIFTRCPGPCPLMTRKMVQLATVVKSPDVRFVSISVDPLHDKPAVLRQYAREQKATDPRIILLTGEGKEIYRLVQSGFKLTAEPASQTSPILHDLHFLLADPAGNVRGAYDSGDPAQLDRLVADANKLANPNARLIARFPALNASLNATAGILLCIAMMFIKANRVRSHAACMIAAVVASTLFLGCYVTFHIMKGGVVTKFPDNAVRPFYLFILTSHTILAVATVPLVFVTLSRAWRRQWDRHRRVATPTFWIWLYVSFTGVLVYWMLYQLAPRMAAAAT
jgi:protein SCO1/2/putative membrane protein